MERFLPFTYLKSCLVMMMLLAATSCSKPVPILKIASNSWIGYEPIYAAKALNLFPFPLVLKRKSNATEVIALFEQGKVDAACLTLDEAMLLIEKGNELYFASVLDISNGADQLVAVQGINSLNDLKGKSIAVETSAVGMLLMNGMLEKSGLNKSDFTIVEATIDQHFDLMSTGKIEAAVTFPPFSERLKSIGGHKLYDSSEMQSAPIIDVLVISKEAYLQKKMELMALLDAIYQTVELLNAGDQETLSIVGQNLNLPKNEWRTMTEGVQLTSKQLNNIYLNRYKLEATMLVLDNVMVNNGMLKRSIKDRIHQSMFIRL